MKHHHFSEVGSTNDYASELLNREDEIAVTADYQTQGRGRNNHVWLGSFGDNLYLSYGRKHKSNLDMDGVVSYQLIGCLAAYHVLKGFANPTKFKMKYPNDIYAYYKDNYCKIAGILVEHTFLGSTCSKSVIGIGINVQQTNFELFDSNSPVSLKMLGYDIMPKELVAPLLSSLKSLLKEPSEIIYQKWAKLLNIIGKEVKILNSRGAWIAKEILPDLRLLIEDVNSGKTMIIDNSESIRYDLD